MCNKSISTTKKNTTSFNGQEHALWYVHTWRLRLRLRQRHRQFNIALMEMQMHTHRMGLNPFLTFYIDTMLNFDGDVDANANANANVKCEHTISFAENVFRFK